MTRNLATLCPAVPEVREYYKQLTERFIKDWDFDGHKLDNIYTVPVCYNPAHHHKSPHGFDLRHGRNLQNYFRYHPRAETR